MFLPFFSIILPNCYLSFSLSEYLPYFYPFFLFILLQPLFFTPFTLFSILSAFLLHSLTFISFFSLNIFSFFLRLLQGFLIPTLIFHTTYSFFHPSFISSLILSSSPSSSPKFINTLFLINWRCHLSAATFTLHTVYSYFYPFFHFFLNFHTFVILLSPKFILLPVIATISQLQSLFFTLSPVSSILFPFLPLNSFTSIIPFPQNIYHPSSSNRSNLPSLANKPYFSPSFHFPPLILSPASHAPLPKFIALNCNPYHSPLLSSIPSQSLLSSSNFLVPSLPPHRTSYLFDPRATHNTVFSLFILLRWRLSSSRCYQSTSLFFIPFSILLYRPPPPFPLTRFIAISSGVLVSFQAGSIERSLRLQSARIYTVYFIIMRCTRYIARIHGAPMRTAPVFRPRLRQTLEEGWNFYPVCKPVGNSKGKPVIVDP